MSEAQDIVSTVAGLQLRAWPLWLLAVATLTALSLGVNTASARLARWLSRAFLAVVVCVGLYAAWKIKWLADDAFISFAYSRRWAEGHGLVLNPGERVEGYTNFLWTMLLAVLGRVGFDIPRAGLFLSLASWLALVGAAVALGPWRKRGGVLPLAALAVAFTRPFFTFATSGLETSFALALAAWATVAWRAKRPVVAGLLFAAAALARPDHLLLAGAVWLVAGLEALRGGDRVRALTAVALRLVLPTLLVFTVYWLLRWWYYGEFFPNTFYAKSGGGSYLSQGFVYAVHALATSGMWLALPFVAYGAWAVRGDEERRPLVWLAVAVACTHGLYVLRVGGDFMEFRFLLPTFFFLLVAWEAVASPWLRGAGLWSRRGAAVAGVCAAWALLALNVRPIGPFEKRWQLAAEDTFYQLSAVYPEVKVEGGLQDLAFTFQRTFGADGRSVRVATGCIGMVAYYGGIDVVDVFGLASRAVAHQPLLGRGRPGHERLATLDSLLAERADLSEGPAWPGRGDDTKVWFGGRTYYVVRSSPKLEALLRKHGASYPDVNAAIARDLQAISREELLANRDFYARYLLPPQSDEVVARFDQALKGSGLASLDASAVPLADVPARLRQAEGLGYTELARGLSARLAFRRDFEADEGSPRDAPWAPVGGALGDQQAVHGVQGERLLNTYVDRDASTGRLELPLPVVEGGLLDLLVGGGSDCGRVSASLYDGARLVQRWCGRNDELLRRVTAPLRGLSAPRLVLADESTGGWGHLLVDDVMVVAGAATPPDAGR